MASTSIANLAIQISMSAGGLQAQVNGVNAQLSQLGKTANQSSSGVSSLAGSFSGLLGAAGIVGGLAGAVQALKWSATLGAEAERTRVAFRVMLGSADEATKMLTDLRNFATETPFSMKGVTESAQLLMQFGVAGKDVIPTMQMIGDVAAGDQQKMDRLALAFGQISAAGRLQGQDLLQLINAGFNPLQEIAAVTGETMLELKQRMADGGVSANEVAAAFAIATGDGGRFNGMMAETAKTASGQLSALWDKAQQIGAWFGEGFLSAVVEVFKVFGSMIQYTVSQMTALQASIYELANSISESFTGQQFMPGMDAEIARLRKLSEDQVQWSKDILNNGFTSSGNNQSADAEAGKKKILEEKAARDAAEAAKKAAAEIEKWKEKADQIAKSVDPFEAYVKKVQELNKAFAIGGLELENYDAALTKAREELFNATKEKDPSLDGRKSVGALTRGSAEASSAISKNFENLRRQQTEAQKQLAEQQRQTKLLETANELLRQMNEVVEVELP